MEKEVSQGGTERRGDWDKRVSWKGRSSRPLAGVPEEETWLFMCAAPLAAPR